VGFGLQVFGGNRNSGVQYDLSSDSEGWLPADPLSASQAISLSGLLSGTTLELRCDTDTDPPEVWEDLAAATVSNIQDRDGDGHDDYAEFSWRTVATGSLITAVLDMDASGGVYDRLVIPEPGTFWLLSGGLMAFSAARRRLGRG
jgi:hypothetical protein